MIHAENLGFRTAEGGEHLLRDISLHIRPGERVGIVGPSGSGKTTLGLHLAGLHVAGLAGRTTGTLKLTGRDCTQNGYEGFAGVVLQNPEVQLFCQTVEEEIELGLRSRPASCDRTAEMERLLGLFGLAKMRDQNVATLSLGWKQRLSVASMLAMGPEVLLLDEPTSYLDESAADELFAVLAAQAASGLTVVVIEHDLPRLMSWAGRILAMDQGRVTFDGPPEDYPAPPTPAPFQLRHSQGAPGSERLRLEHVTFAYGRGQPVLRDVSLRVAAGEIVAIVGPNGSGKSTLLALAKGLLEPDEGRIAGPDTGPLMDTVGLAFQNPDGQLFAHSVAEECAFWPRNQGLATDEVESRTADALEQVGLGQFGPRVPFSLSYGEKRRLTLASVLAGRPAVLCLDEPTVGLDPKCVEELAGILRQVGVAGGAVLLATHDPTLVRLAATRVVPLEAGRITQDTPHGEGEA